MNSFILLAAAAPGNPVTDIAEQFGVTWPLLISQVVLFVIVAVALKKFAYAPILKVLEERRQKIAEGLANAEKIKQELATAQARAQEVFAQASNQANKIIEEAKTSAARFLDQKMQEAVNAANDLRAKSEVSNQAELVRLKAELRREIGRLVASTATKVTGKILTGDDQQRLIEEANRQVAA